MQYAARIQEAGQFATHDEAEVEADALNSEGDLDGTWQTAYVNDGSEGYWIVTLESVECDDPGPDCEIHEGECD